MAKRRYTDQFRRVAVERTKSCENIVAWGWHQDAEKYLIAVNLSDRPAQARVFVGWPDLSHDTWKLTDSISGQSYEREGDELLRSGLYVELPPWGFHFFDCVHHAAAESAPAAAADKVIAAKL